MAKRKAWQRALGGLGEGISNASTLMLRQQLTDQLQDRYDKRQLLAADRLFLSEVNERVAKGEIEPQQASMMLKARGIDVPPTSLEGVRPSLRRRLDPVGSEIDKATTPEGVLSDLSIASAGKREGGFLGDDFMVPGASIDDPFAGAKPEVLEIRDRAETRRRSLQAKPSERVEVEDPLSGVTSTQFVSPYAGPVTTSGTSKQQGALAGSKESATTDVAGPGRAAQAGREAQAVLDVENTPANMKAKAEAARQKRAAELQAELSQMGMTAQQQTAALQLSDDFFTQSKDYYEVASSFRKIASTAQRIREARATGGDSPASNIGMVFAYMKMLDPASTVREGEQAQAAQARGVPDAIMAQYNRLVNGGRLSDSQIADFTQSAAQLYKSAVTDHRGRIQDFTSRATQYRVPAALVVREPASDLDTMSDSPLDRLRRPQ